MLPTYRDYLRILKEAVVYAPVIRDKHGREIICKRPNSFAYIEDIDELMSPNLSAKRGHDFFFDRNLSNLKNPASMTEYSFPGVLITERTIQFDNIFEKQKGHGLINAKMFVMDKAKHKTCTANYCDNRHAVDIFRDCEDIYIYVISYLINTSAYEKDGEIVWLNRLNYQWLLENGKISGYTERKDLYALYKEYMRLRNKDILGRTYDMEGSGALYGMMIDINLPVSPCISVVPNFREYPETIIGKCYV